VHNLRASGHLLLCGSSASESPPVGGQPVALPLFASVFQGVTHLRADTDSVGLTAEIARDGSDLAIPFVAHASRRVRPRRSAFVSRKETHSNLAFRSYSIIQSVSHPKIRNCFHIVGSACDGQH